MSTGRTIEERFARLGQAGFVGVDVIVPGEVSVDDIARARDRTGLRIANVLPARSRDSSLADPDPDVRAYVVEGLEVGIRAAAQLGASSVMLPTHGAEGIDDAQAAERTSAELEPVLAMAQESGVRIALENCWNGFLLTPDAMASFVDALDSPAAAVHFDVGNVSPVGSPEDWIPVLAGRIHKLDLKDFDRERVRVHGIPHGEELELGEGDCDWPAVAAALREIDFEGWASAEVPGSGDALLERMSAAIDRLLGGD